MEKNANNKVSLWGLELANDNITFKWILGVDCLSRLVEQLSTTPAAINVLTVTQFNGPTFNTRSQTRQDSTSNNSTTQANTTPDVSPDTAPTPKPSQQTGWKLFFR